MLVLITYDVATAKPAGRRRLSRIAKACLDYGQRVQNSVFECQIDPTEWTELKHRLEAIIDANEDSLRYYYLGSNWRRRIEHIGAKPSIDMDGLLIG